MSTALRPKAPKTVPKSFDDDVVERRFVTLVEPDDENARAWQECDLAIVLEGNKQLVLTAEPREGPILPH